MIYSSYWFDKIHKKVVPSWYPKATRQKVITNYNAWPVASYREPLSHRPTVVEIKIYLETKVKKKITRMPDGPPTMFCQTLNGHVHQVVKLSLT